MSEGGEARNHEAEAVEAVARALLSEQFDIIDRMPEPKRSEYKADVLGSVGDALTCAGFSSSQGRDTDAPERSPQGEGHEAEQSEPSSLGEDHDLVEAATEASKAMRLYNRNGLSWMELDAVFARLDAVLAEETRYGDPPDPEYKFRSRPA